VVVAMLIIKIFFRPLIVICLDKNHYNVQHSLKHVDSFKLR